MLSECGDKTVFRSSMACRWRDDVGIGPFVYGLSVSSNILKPVVSEVVFELLSAVTVVLVNGRALFGSTVKSMGFTSIGFDWKGNTWTLISPGDIGLEVVLDDVKGTARSGKVM